MTIVVPEPGEEELNDANWINWYVLEGHDKTKYQADNARFWALNTNNNVDYEPRDDWVAFMTAAGWTVKPATLQWAT